MSDERVKTCIRRHPTTSASEGADKRLISSTTLTHVLPMLCFKNFFFQSAAYNDNNGETAFQSKAVHPRTGFRDEVFSSCDLDNFDIRTLYLK